MYVSILQPVYVLMCVCSNTLGSVGSAHWSGGICRSDRLVGDLKCEPVSVDAVISWEISVVVVAK